MKKHITQAALDAAAKALAQAQADFEMAEARQNEKQSALDVEYFLGKKFAIIETVSFFTGLDYFAAYTLLARRLPK